MNIFYSSRFVKKIQDEDWIESFLDMLLRIFDEVFLSSYLLVVYFSFTGACSEETSG